MVWVWHNNEVLHTQTTKNAKKKDQLKLGPFLLLYFTLQTKID